MFPALIQAGNVVYGPRNSHAPGGARSVIVEVADTPQEVFNDKPQCLTHLHGSPPRMCQVLYRYGRNTKFADMKFMFDVPAQEFTPCVTTIIKLIHEFKPRTFQLVWPEKMKKPLKCRAVLGLYTLAEALEIAAHDSDWSPVWTSDSTLTWEERPWPTICVPVWGTPEERKKQGSPDCVMQPIG